MLAQKVEERRTGVEIQDMPRPVDRQGQRDEAS
jgi:hypothetical protein